MKDWVGTSESAFKQIGASNHCAEDREENDYYATDPKAIDDLIQREKFCHDIWECASGGGHLVKRLRELGYCVWSSDLVDRGCQDDIIDFLKEEPRHKYKGDIITNPPYKFATEFILKALDIVETGHKVAMFLKLTTLEGQDRYNKLFKKYPPKTIYVYTKRIECAKNGEFKGSSAVCYAWFVWEKGIDSSPVIKWIV